MTSTVSKTRRERHPLTNYVKIRRALKALMDQCESKTKGRGRINPAPLRKKLARIRKLVRSGSYDE